MPAHYRTVSIWSDLQAAGGVWQGTLPAITKWVTRRRSDGNDSMELEVPLTTPGTDVLGSFSTPALIPPGGPVITGPAISFRDTFATGSQVNANAYTPVPGGASVSGYEYTGSAADFRVESWGQLRNAGGGSTTRPVRVNADLLDDSFEAVIDFSRLSSPFTTVSGGFCFQVPNDNIGAYDNTRYYYLSLTTNSGTHVTVDLKHRTATGDQQLATAGAVAWAASSPKRFRLRVEGLRCRVWMSDAGTGANEVQIFDLSLPVDYRGSTHLRMGFLFGGTSASAIGPTEWSVETIGVDPGVTDPSTWDQVVVDGKVLRVEREDDTVEEWIVERYTDDVDRDVAVVTALPVSAWISERVLIRDGEVYTSQYSGSLSGGLANLLSLGNWPAWIAAGTVEVDPQVVVSYDGDNGTSALAKLVAAANATPEVRLAQQTIRVAWRRLGATGWAIDLLVSPVDGQPAFVEGRNLTALAIANDRHLAAQVVWPANEEGSSIARAHLLVAAVDTGTERVKLTDWSCRLTDLTILVDGQWVGKYLTEPDGTLHEITDSFAATQELEITGIVSGDFEVGDMVRITEADGTPVFACELPDRLHPKQVQDVRPWPSTVNWAMNATFARIEGSPLCPVYWEATDGAAGHLSIETDPQYIETGVQSLLWEAEAADEKLIAIDIRHPKGSFVGADPPGPSNLMIVHYGIVYWSATDTLRLERLITGSSVEGGIWGDGTTLTSDGDRRMRRGSVALSWTNGNRGLRLRLRTTAAGDVRVDRVWMIAEPFASPQPIPTEEMTRTPGNGPTLGLFEGNRTLRDRADGGLSYTVSAIDRYRESPTIYPDDRLEVHQVGRLVAPIRGVDVLLPISELVVNELRRHSTQVTVGAPRRRLTDLIRG